MTEPSTEPVDALTPQGHLVSLSRRVNAENLSNSVADSLTPSSGTADGISFLFIMSNFERDTLDRMAAAELVILAGKTLQNNFPSGSDCLVSLCRSIALLEMSGRIPEVQSLDLTALTHAARQADFGWVIESIQQDVQRLQLEASHNQKDAHENPSTAAATATKLKQ